MMHLMSATKKKNTKILAPIGQGEEQTLSQFNQSLKGSDLARRTDQGFGLDSARVNNASPMKKNKMQLEPI